MLHVLRNPSYAKLFSAQVIALIGTGLLTVALGLLAFRIAGSNAGVVLGTALMIKMIAYVTVSPVMAALTANLPRKPILIIADVVRAAIALSLPWVSEAWQIYVLIFVLQAASATFTPTFQAVIPEILPDERDYTAALSLSRLAYDLESVLSPMLAAALLTFLSYSNLFLGTVIGFVGSALLVGATALPPHRPDAPAPFLQRLTRGVRIFGREPQLRALLALNVVVAACAAFVIVNTVVLVQGYLAMTEADVALLLAAYGAGSMIVALVLPRVLDSVPDRPVMLAGGLALPAALAAIAAVLAALGTDVSWPVLLALWTVSGAANALVLTPSARLLRRASTEESRPAVFAAQFSLSHACFLLTYPIAGTLGARLGLATTAGILAAIGAIAFLAATALWKEPRAVRSA